MEEVSIQILAENIQKKNIICNTCVYTRQKEENTVCCRKMGYDYADWTYLAYDIGKRRGLKPSICTRGR